MTYADAPIDSAEVRERREAEEAAQEQAARADREHAEQCRRGWLGDDEDGRPVPCPRCRPHTQRTSCWICGQSYAACKRRRDARLSVCCEHCDHQPTHRFNRSATS